MMSYHEALSQRVIAISTSDSPDMPALGLSDEHLKDAMAEIARHLLALGARLVYGGDLRARGFTELLFELVARHRRDADEGDDRSAVINYLAWPVHISMKADDLRQLSSDLAGSAKVVCLALDGSPLMPVERQNLVSRQPTKSEWAQGLTAMRDLILRQTDARIVLGGRVDQYMGVMPGIAEEALLSLHANQPLFLIGGFGGCSRDIAQTLGLIAPWPATSRPDWRGREQFKAFTVSDLSNGLTSDDNAKLARTPHVDEAVILILRGLLHASATKP